VNLKNKVTYQLLPVIFIIALIHIVALYLYLVPNTEQQASITIQTDQVFLLVLCSSISIFLLSVIALVIFRSSIDKYFNKTIDYITEFIVDFGEHSKIDSDKRKSEIDEIESVTECLNFMRSRVNIHQKTMEKLAYYDSLTGLPNKQYLKQELKRMLAGARRRKSHLAVLSLDLNEFKTINDSMGFDCGDLLLTEASKRMSRHLRDNDFIDRNEVNETNINIEGDNNLLARFTGAKFTLLLNDIDDPSSVSIVASRILEGMSIPFKLNKHEVEVTTSIGISIYPQDGRDVDGLLKAASYAMSEAKKVDEDSYQYYTDEMNAAASKRLKLEQDLRDALDNNELRLHLHPRIKLENMKVCGFEALVRWQNPELGLVMPGEFLPLAEETILICEIGNWVFDKVCQQIKLCLEEGIEDIKVSVNLSKMQIYRGDTYNLLKTYMDLYGVSGKHLEIEVTESGVFDDEKVAMKLLEELRSLGISISLDDFGSGYSSLRFLQNAPIDTIKIDRRFVSENSHKTSGQQLLTSVMEIAKNLNFSTVASGIEVKEQIDFFKSIKCDYVQGYYYSEPIPSDDMVDFLVQWNKTEH
jgi:diguanylate cyclase (GGDEF)-like protein